MVYALAPLLMIALVLNFVLIRREVEDYKILGDFSKEFVQKEAEFIKNSLEAGNGKDEVTIYKGSFHPLGDIYTLIVDRGNMPKLLPFRRHGIGGVIEPRHLLPIIFYPAAVARWQSSEETETYFKGRVVFD